MRMQDIVVMQGKGETRGEGVDWCMIWRVVMQGKGINNIVMQGDVDRYILQNIRIFQAE